MTEQALLKKQFEQNYQWTLRLVAELDEENWQASPAELNTNINWQLGHIVLTQYFQALTCTGSPRDRVKAHVPIKTFIAHYAKDTKPMQTEGDKPDKAALLQALELVQQEVIKAIDLLSSDALDAPTEVAHPLAKTKREALAWCAQHQAWHNGQIALIKRMLTGKSF